MAITILVTGNYYKAVAKSVANAIIDFFYVIKCPCFQYIETPVTCGYTTSYIAAKLACAIQYVPSRELESGFPLREKGA